MTPTKQQRIITQPTSIFHMLCCTNQSEMQCASSMATNARFRWNNVVANMSLHGGETAVSGAMKTIEDIKLQINVTTANYASYNRQLEHTKAIFSISDCLKLMWTVCTQCTHTTLIQLFYLFGFTISLSHVSDM